MAQFYEKNGLYMEQKNSWRSVIAQEDAMLIVKKNIKNKCSSEIKTDARNDISHIIGKWFKLLMDEYNIGLESIKQAKNISWLYNKIKNNHAVQSRVSNLVRGHGMEIEEFEMLFSYKLERNEKGH
ncbi:hypothetical protein GLOIN_2v1774297 [Rhizophagus irregularis DAOM 181602=DAOM 197198]|nr:hypothetical protein GLOIN_2v1774297 [Rhizophagus irregularis DAOM 181602=DAOM 197198]